MRGQRTTRQCCESNKFSPVCRLVRFPGDLLKGRSQSNHPVAKHFMKTRPRDRRAKRTSSGAQAFQSFHRCGFSTCTLAGSFPLHCQPLTPRWWRLEPMAVNSASGPILITISSRGSEHGDLFGHWPAQVRHPALFASAGDERFVNRHKLAPEFEMQHGSAQSRETFLGGVGLREATGPKHEEPKARKAQIPEDSRRVLAYLRSPLRVWRGLVSLSHEPLGSDVNALQRLVVGDRKRYHCRDRNAHGVQRR
jgi:hypothetical protein